MRDWLSNDIVRALLGVLAGAGLVVLRFLILRPDRGALRAMWRSSGLAARVALGLGCGGGIVGFLAAVQEAPPRWAAPVLWTGFGLAMAAACAAGLTTRADGAPARRRKRDAHRDQVT